MCVRYNTVDKTWEKFSRRHGVWTPTSAPENPPLMPDLFPGDRGSVVVPDADHGLAQIEARWGLQPGWAKEADFGRKNAYNARAETVAEKPSFRSAFRHRRCIVPASAFYERAQGRWLRISPVDDAGFAIAGLFEPPNDLSEGTTFTMVTTEPNLAIAEVHDRMPVVLAPADVAAWTSPETDVRELRALLLPCPPEWITIEDAGPIGGRRTGEKGLFD